MFTLRAATPADVPAILQISNQYAATAPANFATEPESLESWQQSWRETNEMYPWLVAVEDASSILGFAKASPWKSRGAYRWSVETSVYVKERAQRRGIGKALYARLIELLRAQGYHTLLGGITLPNDPSVRLHESLGFRRVGVLHEVGFKLGAWHDVGYWLLTLRPDERAPGPVRPVRDVAVPAHVGD
jgi:phosphinothricin acetyltransferase